MPEFKRLTDGIDAKIVGKTISEANFDDHVAIRFDDGSYIVGRIFGDSSPYESYVDWSISDVDPLTLVAIGVIGDEEFKARRKERLLGEIARVEREKKSLTDQLSKM